MLQKINNKYFLIFGLLALIFFSFGCAQKTPDETYPKINRADKLPADIAKREPKTDVHPPILHSKEYEKPVPLASAINTSGAEDSPFILPDGNTLYFFFTPDVRIPVEKQILDSVTGVWVSRKINDEWQKAERVWLEKQGKLSLDGAVAIQNNEMWFASAREGFEDVNMFTAELKNNVWTNWKYSGDRLMKELKIGEVHIHGNELYFHSDRPGGFGLYDIWTTTRNKNAWSEPINIENVNSEEHEGWPFVSADGNELWFTRTYKGTPAIFRSIKNDGVWSEPELIISQFAGEPTLDEAGNIYFVHHYYENDIMIEADIYVAHKK